MILEKHSFSMQTTLTAVKNIRITENPALYYFIQLYILFNAILRNNKYTTKSNGKGHFLS